MDIIALYSLQALLSVLSLYTWVIFITIILNLLFAFGILDVNKGNFISTIYFFGKQITEPLFNRIRSFLPNLGPLDFSPLIVLTIIYILMEFLRIAIVKIHATNLSPF